MRLAALALISALASTTAAHADDGHYRRQSFTQYVGQGFVMKLPETDVPVRIDVSARIDGKPIAGSMVMSALVTQDPYTRAISWVGTDSDGGNRAGNTDAGDGAIARILAPDGTAYAVLVVDNVSKGRVKLVQKAAAAGAKGAYTVTFRY